MSRAPKAARTLAASEAATRRSVVTPEGVDLRLQVADLGARFAAFLLDVLIILAVLTVLTVVTALSVRATGFKGAQVYAVIWLLGAFVIRNAYFLTFEMGPRGATPGKRALGIRVAARNGGRLSTEAVFARNAMREVEVLLPLSFLLARANDIDSWTVLLGLAWSGIFLFFPMFNRDRLRVGDLIAGSWVVRAPKARLLPDLSDRGPRPEDGFAFSDAQLQAYGVKELHVLETVLRAKDPQVMKAVAERIRRKIDWEPRGGERYDDFLAAYYAGLRGRLEQRLLFGHRRKDKFDKA